MIFDQTESFGETSLRLKFVLNCFMVTLIGVNSASGQETHDDQLARARATVLIERMASDCTENAPTSQEVGGGMLKKKCWEPAGSGFFSTPDGLWIITAAHVLYTKEKSQEDFKFRVRVGSVQREVQVRGFDKEADIACLAYPRELTEFPVNFIPAGDPSSAQLEDRFLVAGYPAGGAWQEDAAFINSFYVHTTDDLSHHGKWRMQFTSVAAGDSGGPVIDTLTNRAVAIVSEAQPLGRQFYAAPLKITSPCLSRFAPSEVDIWIRQADAAISMGDFPTARELFRKAAMRDRSRWEPIFGQARVAFLTAHYDEALQYYQKLSVMLRDDLTTVYQQTICLDGLHRYDDALELLNTIKAKSEPTSYLYKSAIFDIASLNLVKALSEAGPEKWKLLERAKSAFEEYHRVSADFPQQWAWYGSACIEALEADRNRSESEIRQAEMLFDKTILTVKSLGGAEAEAQRKLLQSVLNAGYERLPGAPPYCQPLVKILESRDQHFRDKL